MKALYIFFLCLTIGLFFVLPFQVNPDEQRLVFMLILASIMGALVFGTLWADQPAPTRQIEPGDLQRRYDAYMAARPKQGRKS